MPTQSSPKFMSEKGTVWIYPDIIKSTDRTSFRSISQPTTSNVTMYDREEDQGRGKWVTADSYVFSVDYDDGINTSVTARSKDFTAPQASVAARQFAESMGRLPACLRKGVTSINLMKGDREWGGNSATRSLDIQIGKFSTEYEALGITEEVLAHESTHAALDDRYYGPVTAEQPVAECKPIWKAAQDADGEFVSKYAADNPSREDVAESFVPYIAAIYRSNRISAPDAKKINDAIPERIRVFKDAGLDMYPLDQVTLDAVIGRYTFGNPTNDWHHGEITLDGSELKWTNRAGVSWRLIPDLANAQLLTDDSFPYQDQFQNFVLSTENGNVSGFTSNNDYWEHN